MLTQELRIGLGERRLPGRTACLQRCQIGRSLGEPESAHARGGGAGADDDDAHATGDELSGLVAQGLDERAVGTTVGTDDRGRADLDDDGARGTLPRHYSDSPSGASPSGSMSNTSSDGSASSNSERIWSSESLSSANSSSSSKPS